jgi:hypothetical protein
MKVAVAVLVLIGSSNAVVAGEFTGMELRRLCVGEKEDQDICRTWISGFHSGLRAAQSIAKEARVTCIPNGTSGDQARLIIEKSMADHPNILQLGADVVSYLALTRAFPCPSKKSN